MPNGHGDDYRVDHGDLNDLREEILTEKDVRRIVQEELRLVFSRQRRQGVPTDTEGE